MSDALRVNLNNTSPSLSDTIQTEDGPTDITGASVKFQMREVESATLKVDSSAVITAATSGGVRYDWGSSDLNTQGEYRAWWRVTFSSGRVQDTPEFALIVDTHTPGDGVEVGAIALRAREYMPVSYDALARDARYGERLIQNRISSVKYRLFATVVSPGLEATTYDLFVQEFVGKMSCLQLVPAAIEYWSDQHTSVSTTGTQESVAYPDRIRSLQALQEWLIAEVRRDKPDIDAVIGVTIRRRGRYPKVSTTRELVTPDPGCFPPTFGRPWPRNIYVPFASESALTWPF